MVDAHTQKRYAFLSLRRERQEYAGKQIIFTFHSTEILVSNAIPLQPPVANWEFMHVQYTCEMKPPQEKTLAHLTLNFLKASSLPQLISCSMGYDAQLSLICSHQNISGDCF